MTKTWTNADISKLIRILFSINTVIFKQAVCDDMTLTLTLNKIYFDINEKDKQQEIDNMISRYQ